MTDKPGQGETVDRWGTIHRDGPAMMVLQTRCQHENCHELRYRAIDGRALDVSTCLDCGRKASWAWQPSASDTCGVGAGVHERFVLADRRDDWRYVRPDSPRRRIEGYFP